MQLLRQLLFLLPQIQLSVPSVGGQAYMDITLAVWEIDLIYIFWKAEVNESKSMLDGTTRAEIG